MKFFWKLSVFDRILVLFKGFKLSENIVSGLVSGVLATFLVFVFNSIWKNSIVPWFEERVYKDVAIEGVWYSCYPNDRDKRQEAIQLIRHGHAVTGDMICIHGRDTGEKYIVAGSFRNMILPLTYETADSKKTDRGTITLKSIHNGERLMGKIALYNTNEDSIETATVIWFRSKSDLDLYVTEIDKRREQINELQQKARKIDKELKSVEEVLEKSPADGQAVDEANSPTVGNPEMLEKPLSVLPEGPSVEPSPAVGESQEKTG